MSLFGFFDDEVQNFSVFIDNLEEDERRYKNDSFSNDSWGGSLLGKSQTVDEDDNDLNDGYDAALDLNEPRQNKPEDYTLTKSVGNDQNKGYAIYKKNNNQSSSGGNRYTRMVQRKSFVNNKIKQIPKTNPICMKCCSENIYYNSENKPFCRSCAKSNQDSTVIYASTDFFEKKKPVLADVEEMQSYQLRNYSWTNVVRYASHHGLLGDKKNAYDNIINNNDAKSLFELYKAGNCIATAKLAECYAFGTGVEKNTKAAYKLFLIAEQMGESYAAFIRANYLFYTHHMSDYGFSVLGGSACANNPVSMYQLAQIIEQRKTVNYEKISYDWWKKSANLGFMPSVIKCQRHDASTFDEIVDALRLAVKEKIPMAQKELYELYDKKYQETKDEKYFDSILSDCFDYYHNTWENNYIEKGRKVIKNPESVIGQFEEWLYANREEITNALLGDRKVSFAFTDTEKKELIKEELEKYIYNRRIETDETSITINLDYTEDLGSDDDEDEIDYESMNFDELLKRAKDGDSWAELLVGDAYHYGNGVPVNIEDAIRWYMKASRHDENWGYVELARIYMQKHDKATYNIIKANQKACAYGLYSKAANRGNECACRKLGSDYIRPTSPEKDKERRSCYIWNMKAAIHGSSDGYNMLAICYQERLGIDIRDYVKAFNLYKKSADMGNSHAMFNLGLCYEDGIGVPKDYNLAAKWYKKAHDNGEENAAEKCDRLYRENKVSSQNNITNVDAASVEKGSVSEFYERVMEHLEKGYFEDAAANIRHIEETILSYFVQIFIPECVFDNKGEQRKKLENAKVIPKHYIEILYNISKVGNSGAHANGSKSVSVTEQDIRRVIPPLKDLINYYEEFGM
ncbi:tetratricopeptide repeat protein [Butyrivibrio sp. FC2001]|uniref:tetratricopeptide repeat protein n=1 Tax=Butyrivibrio sp. FC2001 TaxID=1280671 RepID=UPI00040C9E5D|nr:SEL1-like repeat protein [Butyrivibrio sp. FC2001]